VRAAARIDTLLPMAIVTLVAFALAVASAALFLRHPSPAAGRRFNTLSGLWTLGVFLGLGIMALV
jgi:hypothetical protein